MHSHILPNIDDGSRSMKETLNMIYEGVKYGFDKIVLTPHYIEGYYQKDEETRIELIKRIQSELKDESIKLYIGNEIYLSENTVKLLKRKKISSINNTSYVLFELPRCIKPMSLNNMIYEMLEHKIKPILAHPERYEFIYEEPEIIHDLIEKGVLMQANYGSIIGKYGRKAELIVKRMLENDMIHLLGTDVHRENTIYQRVPQIIKELNQIVGKEKQIELTEINPNKVLNNEEIYKEIPKELKLTLKEKMIMKYS